MRLAACAIVAAAWLAAAPAMAACDAPSHRQFDFWLGTWQVKGPAGRVAGTNRIESEYGGCVIHERYTTPGGYTGESLNMFDAARGVWHQTWVDNGGTLLLLEGAFRDGRMVLESPAAEAGRPVTRHRITWTPNADGTVRQLWESTAPDGKQQVVFDGLYTRQ